MPTPQVRDYALVVGIDRYADASFEPLNGPKNDIKRFISWLKSPNGGNIPKSNIDPYVLRSDKNGKRPVSGDFIAVVKALLALSPGGETRIGRRLYIFLAGHGVGPGLDDVGLLTVEATDDAATYVEGRSYANLFRGRAVFEEVVLIMDCCRDFDGELPDPIFPFKLRIDAGAAHKVKRFYAYATGFGRAARETEFGKEVNGIFSHVLMAGLKRGAVDGEGRITGPSLERYVKKHVIKFLPPGIDQVPEIHCDSNFVFAEGFPPARVKVMVETTVPYHRFVILYGDGLKAVETAPQNLGAGKFQIQLRVGKTYVFRLLDAAGNIIREDGQAVEDVDEVINVTL